MRGLTIYILFLSITTCYGQHDFDSLYEHNLDFKQYFDTYAQDYDFFDGEDPINVTLESDFKNLIKRKYKDEYQQAVMSFEFNDSIVIRRNVKIKPRGHFRRKNCFNPPLKINFDKKEVMIPQLKEFDKLKMVDVCRNSNMYEQYLLTEFLVYKAYNVLTDYSFRVRLIKVNYIDTGGKYKPRIRYAFIIEDVKQVAYRHRASLYKKDRISPASTDQKLTGMMDVFQYMIGNTDYYIPMEHNIKMIKLNDPTRPRPLVIPYDFDYSGIVNASYAIPSEILPIENVRQRLYMGNCQTEKRYMEIIEQLKDKQEDIIGTYEKFPYLDSRTRKYTTGYLKQFFDMTDERYFIRNEFLKNCKQ